MCWFAERRGKEFACVSAPSRMNQSRSFSAPSWQTTWSARSAGHNRELSASVNIEPTLRAKTFLETSPVEVSQDMPHFFLPRLERLWVSSRLSIDWHPKTTHMYASTSKKLQTPITTIKYGHRPEVHLAKQEVICMVTHCTVITSPVIAKTVTLRLLQLGDCERVKFARTTCSLNWMRTRWEPEFSPFSVPRPTSIACTANANCKTTYAFKVAQFWVLSWAFLQEFYDSSVQLNVLLNAHQSWTAKTNMQNLYNTKDIYWIKKVAFHLAIAMIYAQRPSLSVLSALLVHFFFWRTCFCCCGT